MPSTATITSTAFTSFTAGTKIKSAEVNSNFNIWRGHNIPVDASASAAANGTYDLGSSDYQWRNLYVQNIYGPTRSVIASTTGAITMTAGSAIVVIANTGATVTATLPAVAGVTDGTIMRVKRAMTSTYTVVVDGNGTETIDNTTVVSLINPGDSFTLVKLSSEWHLI